MENDMVSCRMRQYLAEKQWTAKYFETLTGLGNGTCSKIGTSTRMTTFNRIANSSVDLNIDWLLTGEGDMLRNVVQKESATATRLGHPYAVSSQDDEAIPVRFFQVTPAATFKEFCEGGSELSETVGIVPPKGETIDESSCVFEITGESMAPQIPDGARVLCREVAPSKWHTITKGVVVIAYADRFVIKRIAKNRLASDDFLVLCSDNPDYPAEEVVARADIRCLFQARHVLSYPIH